MASYREFGPWSTTTEYSTDDHAQLQPQDTLVDRGVDDVLDEGFTLPERPHARNSCDVPESLDQLLSEEAPDPASRINVLCDDDERERSDAAEREAEFPQWGEAGRVRAGRLVAPDQGSGEDTEAELVAEDVGISGGAASAEEAAVHIVDDVR